MLLSWRCTNPSGGASFMIWLVPPGFILGGATMAIGFAHPWVRAISEGIPLVHVFAFWRDIGLRGDVGGDRAVSLLPPLSRRSCEPSLLARRAGKTQGRKACLATIGGSAGGGGGPVNPYTTVQDRRGRQDERRSDGAGRSRTKRKGGRSPRMSRGRGRPCH